MTLFNFVKEYICPNSLIRLWFEGSDGYEMIQGNGESVCMEHKLLDCKTWQSRYGNYKVVGIKDIYVDDFYREAINITIKKER